jgi:putative heme-binding domain-containing protein
MRFQNSRLALNQLGPRSGRQIAVLFMAALAAFIPANAGSFALPPGFAIQRILSEPDIINPMTLCVDEEGSLWVSEAHTYRWGPEGSPFQPPGNPIKRVKFGTNGEPEGVLVAADGFPEPVMGIHVHDGQLYATSLNELFVMDIAPDGRLRNRRLLVRDAAVPWNPFGMYRVQAGPDAKLWLSIADHPATEPVTLTGSDGRVVRLRGQSGGLVRCNLDGSRLEIVAQGFRAPFSFDIDPWGRLWQISNGEGSPNLYALVIPGLDYGYATREVSYDWLAGREALSPPVTYMGTGASTAALHYYSSMFPPEYWGGIFIANWGSHGANPPDREIRRFVRAGDAGGGAGGRGAELVEVDKFLTTTDPMFRPTALALAHDGGIYLSDWHGRDDENNKFGRIYKIVYAREGALDPLPVIQSSQEFELAEMAPVQLAELLGHSNHWAREKAVRALTRAGEAALEPLSRVAHDGDPLAAACAVWTLTRLDSFKAAEVLLQAACHADPRVGALALRQLRQFAGHSLGGEGLGVLQTGRPPPPPLFSPEKLEQFAEELLDNPDAELRVEAALAIRSPEGLARGLLAALEIADDPRLRHQIGFELGRRGDEAALHSLRNSADPERRRVGWIAADAARQERSALASVVRDWVIPGSDTLIQADFLERLEAGDLILEEASDKLLALEQLARHPPTKLPFGLILACLEDSDSRLQEAAVRMARRSGSRDARLLEPILRLLDDCPPNRLRLEGVYLMGLEAGKMDAGRWRSWFEDDSSELVIAALRALRQVAQPSELASLVREISPRLAKRHPLLGEEAAFTLGVLEPSGLPGGRPASSLAEVESKILGRLPQASAELGRLAFDSMPANCFVCHATQPGELRMGPSLAGIGRLPAQYLVESILQPSRVIKTGFQTELIETSDGRALSGLVEVRGEQLIVHAASGQREIVPLSGITRRAASPISPMPDGYETILSLAELADLTAFLLSLREE